jgi:hypothetical protein
MFSARSEINGDEDAPGRGVSATNWLMAAIVVGAIAVVPACSRMWFERAVAMYAGRISLADDIAAGETDRVEAALRAVTDVDECDAMGYTPLIWAAGRDDVGLVRRLLDLGASPSAISWHGVTPLSMAASQGRVDIMQLLLQAGAAVDQPAVAGGTALHAAAWEGQTDAVAFLLAHGANVNARDHHSQTALAFCQFVDGKPGVAETATILGRATDKGNSSAKRRRASSRGCETTPG